MTGLPTITVKLDDGTGTFPYDISSYARLPEGISYNRGRADEESEVQASSLDIVLENDGRFTLGSTTIASPSPIYVDNRIRVTYTVGSTVSHRFTGFVQDWPTEWPDGGDQFAVARIKATDRLPRLARRVLRSVIEQEYLRDSPTAYYTLGDPAGSTSASDTSGNNIPAAISTGIFGTPPTFGTAAGPGTDALTAVTFTPTSNYLQANLTLSTGTSVLLETFVSTTGTSQVMVYLGPTSSDSAFIGISSGGFPYVALGDAAPDLVVSAITANDGATHHVAGRLTESGGAITMRVYVDGVLRGSGTSSTVLSLASFDRLLLGHVHTTLTMAHAAVWRGTEITDARIAAHSDAGLTGFTSDTSDQRVARYASYGNIATADQVLESGVLTNVPNLDITGMSPAAAIKAVDDAEGGLVFARGDGKLVMQNRQHRTLKVAADWTITNDDIDPGSAFTADMQRVTNYVTATRSGGSPQVAKNQASIDRHEQYPTSYGDVLVPTDAQALDLASWQVGTHAEPAARLPDVTIDLLTQTQAFQEAWLARELSDRVKITPLPSQSPVSTADLVVEGWTETVTDQAWTVQLNTTPWALEQAWVLDDTTYSVLGTTTRLGY